MRALSIVVVAGPDRGARAELHQGSLLVGSLDSCDLKLTDPTVSRQHARLELRTAGLHVTDLRSHNGTVFNGSRITEAIVPLGARLKVGESELRVDALGRERPSPGGRSEYFGLAGGSAAMRELIAQVEKVAPTPTTVLLHGETGTGKEVAARALHAGSGRKGALVVFDCGAVQPELLASELFGHVKGAFTDAVQERKGAVERADRGTLFFDEIGELELTLQPALLRLLERKEVQPVGGTRTRKVDVRVIAATHRNLQEDVEAGRFRPDLLFRLEVVTLTVPPLRERLDDLPLLARRLIEDAGLKYELDDDSLNVLRGYVWPGNVRELGNVLLRTATLGGAISLPESTTQAATQRRVEPKHEEPEDYRAAREAMMGRFEREYLLDLLARHDHNVTQAAKAAGIGRAHLYRLLKKSGIE